MLKTLLNCVALPPGTYNNQYMVIDLKQIELNSVVKDNALWVVEQIPGLSVADDLTPILRKGKNVRRDKRGGKNVRRHKRGGKNARRDTHSLFVSMTLHRP